jgi:hypothetical protein
MALMKRTIFWDMALMKRTVEFRNVPTELSRLQNGGEEEVGVSPSVNGGGAQQVTGRTRPVQSALLLRASDVALCNRSRRVLHRP